MGRHPVTQQTAFTPYVGQVERDGEGQIWAVLYREGHIIAREKGRSLRWGKRRVTDMLLSAADTSALPANSMRRAPASAEEACRNGDASLEPAGWGAGGRWRPAHLV